jgi:DNA-binding transcriptional LysR family regulator
VSNLESACDAARSGVGIAVALSYHIADQVKSGDLVPLLQEFQPPSQPVSLVYSPNRFMPVKLRAFLDFTLPRLKRRLEDAAKNATPRGQVNRSSR